MANTKLDFNSILDGATQQLEERFAEIQRELAPLREEERQVADAIQRLVGSFPDGYRPAAAFSTTRSRAQAPSRERLSPEEREAQVLQVASEHSEGVNGKQIADELGVSAATAEKAIKGLIEQKKLRVEGERRTRKLYLA